jgi:protein-disulfide isomerase
MMTINRRDLLASTAATLLVMAASPAFAVDMKALNEAPAYGEMSIKFVFREFPHNDAALAAFMVARCAPKEKYFPLMDVLFATQEDWLKDPLAGLTKISQQAGMTKEQFDACLKNEAVAKQILEVRKKAETLGVTSIPSFFINGELLKGESSIEEMKKAIDPLLS